jgi:hypothetical protein
MSKKPTAKSSTAKSKAAAARQREEAERTRRLGLAAGIAGAAAVLGAAVYALFGPPFRAPEEGHDAPDLAPDAPAPGTDRAPEAFRPDPAAPVAAADREALRPATVPVGNVPEPPVVSAPGAAS